MMKQSQQGPLVDVIQQAQRLLQRDGDSFSRAVLIKHRALLLSLLRCSPCGCAISHTRPST